MIIFGTILTNTSPAPIESNPAFLTVGIPFMYGFIAITAAAWFIQTRRAKRRDADYESALENHHQKLAAEAAAAYRNGFDDGQSKSSITT
jgi:predicted signal transduction protein with EAL and GGDEF domain